MSRFTGPLTITHIGTGQSDWRLWRLEQPLIYEIGRKGSDKKVYVPAGFVTDGATVPRLLWWLFPRWGTYSRAVAVHDFLIHLLRRRTPHQYVATRRAADKIFYEAMGPCGTNWVVRVLMYAGVRVGALLASIRE